MKTAFIFSQFPCYDETFILREMNELKKTGLEFDIYSLKIPKDKIIHDEAKSLLQVTRYMPFFSLELLVKNLFFLFRYPGRYLAALFQVLVLNLKSPNFFFKTCVLWFEAVGFAWVARGAGVRHVHGQWATYPATVAFIISKLNNIPFSFTGHAHDIYLDTTMLAFKLRRAKFVTTCTEDNKKYLLDLLEAKPRQSGPRLSLGDKKVIVNYHGVDLNRFMEEGRMGREEGRKFKILSVGSLLECKGFEYLIEACGILKERSIDFECTIAGGGKLEQSLKSQVERIGLFRGETFSEGNGEPKVSPQSRGGVVRFTGYITQEKLIPIYKEADVFVLAMVPDKHWGIPNVLIEALACSVPVVCTMLPSIPELVEDGKTGYIIPARDPAAIALILERLYRDKALSKQIGAAGRKVVEEKFDVVKNALRLKDIFEAV